MAYSRWFAGLASRLYLLAVVVASFSGLVSASPTTCQPTRAQGLYTNASDFLTFVQTPPHSSIWKLKLGQGRYTGDFPDCISFNGTRVQRLNATGTVYLDAAKGSGDIAIEWYSRAMSPEEGKTYSGHFKATSSNFQSDPPADHYVPFQRNGISQAFLQHGCSAQGETAFPLLRSHVSTWGYVDIYNNGQLIYPHLWLHTMYTQRCRDFATNAIFADATHTRPYSPARCWEGDVSTTEKEFHFIAARWCESRDKHAVHPVTDVNIIFSFTDIKDLSPSPQ